MQDDNTDLKAHGSRDELVAKRERLERQLHALRDASDGENPPPQIHDLEEALHELDVLIDRIDIAVELERQMDA